jgi:hypothetical protein
MATQQTELFGTAQGSLFGDGEDRIPHPAAPSTAPDPEKVRRKLLGLLEKARTAQTMPWNARDARMYQTIFPNMANWLPDDEANQLRFAFAQEMQRLSHAA